VRWWLCGASATATVVKLLWRRPWVRSPGRTLTREQARLRRAGPWWSSSCRSEAAKQPASGDSPVLLYSECASDGSGVAAPRRQGVGERRRPYGAPSRWSMVGANRCDGEVNTWCPNDLGLCDILPQGLVGLIEYSYHQGMPSFPEAQL
jgi:hypothetical protein